MLPCQRFDIIEDCFIISLSLRLRAFCFSRLLRPDTDICGAVSLTPFACRRALFASALFRRFTEPPLRRRFLIIAPAASRLIFHFPPLFSLPPLFMHAYQQKAR
jgi:hypothetical protein